MVNARIGIFDSGVGGLTVAREIRKLLPKEALVYVADNARAPYGPQSKEAILQYSFTVVQFLVNQGVDIVVVACNTATSAAIEELRVGFPDTLFVGMEPAVKPAAANSKANKIGVMATELTLKGDRYLELVDRFAARKEIYTNPCKGLVKLIEEGDFESPAIESKLESILRPMLDAGIDTLVLGCTHYPLLWKQIDAICGGKIAIIDPAPAAARQAARLLSSLLAKEECLCTPFDRFYASGSSIALETTLQRLDWKWRLCTGNVA